MAIVTAKVCDGCGKVGSPKGKHPIDAEALIAVSKIGGMLNACSLGCLSKATVRVKKGEIQPATMSTELLMLLWPETYPTNIFPTDNTESQFPLIPPSTEV